MKLLIESKKHKDVIQSMFFSAAIAMIFTELVGVVAIIIDGMITSIYFGEVAYSAISLSSPLANMVLMLAGFISTGSQIVCSQKIGRGEKKEANAAFSIAVICGVIISLIYIVVCIAFPVIMFRICGVSPDKHAEFYPYMCEYLKGYLIGVPAIVIVQVISPILVMDNDKKLVQFSAVVLCLFDIIGDIANAAVFNGGVFGMGVATSIAYILEMLVLMLHFASKRSYFKFDLRGINIRMLKDMVLGGSPALVRKLATIIRDIVINRLNLVVALSTAAVAARALQNDIILVMFSIGLGIGKVLITMTGMYHGAKDMQGLKRLYIYAVKVSVVISVIAGVIMLIFAHPIARLYSDDVEIVNYSVFAICCFAAVLPLDTLSVALQSYLQGIKNLKLVNIMTFSERLFIPVITAILLGIPFGSKGILASIAVGKILIVLILFIIICIRKRGLPKEIRDFMFLSGDFGGEDKQNYYAKLNTMEDIMSACGDVREFCIKNDIDKKKAHYIYLFIEEMAGNIIKHNAETKKADASIDLRIFTDNNQIFITLRDYYNYFDPTEYYKKVKDENTSEKNGIRIVMELAKEVRYVSAFNSNNVMILV